MIHEGLEHEVPVIHLLFAKRFVQTHYPTDQNTATGKFIIIITGCSGRRFGLVIGFLTLVTGF